MSEADGAPGDEPVLNSYVVNTPVGAQTFVAVAEVTVGPWAELVLGASDGGCIAMFAPGQWRWVEVAEIVEEDGE